MNKGPMGIMMAVIGAILVIVVTYEMLNAVDTSTWSTGVVTIIKTVVTLCVAIGAAIYALKAIR